MTDKGNMASLVTMMLGAGLAVFFVVAFWLLAGFLAEMQSKWHPGQRR
jgi:hypothetical protein